MKPSHLALLLALAPIVVAYGDDEWTRLPQRKPEFGQKMSISVEVLANEIDDALESGSFDFDVAYWKPDELSTSFTLATNRAIQGKFAPGERAFATTKDYDPAGNAMPFAAAPAFEHLARVVDTSDLALVPMRTLLRHQMPSGTGGGAEKELSGSGYHVRYMERFSGVRTVSMTPLQMTRGRSVRTFAPSGFRLIDHFLTFEDARDNSMMGALCVRVLWHPNLKRADGTRPPGGVFYAAKLRLNQIDWLKENTVIPEDVWDKEEDEWHELLAEDLFDSISNEAIGDPFDSPSAFALRALHLLTPPVLNRLATRTDPKLLSSIAALVVDQPVSYDPARFDKAYDKAFDPLQRLLLGAAACAAGSKQRERYLRDVQIALNGKQPATLRAAFLLARVLEDESLTPSIVQAIEKAPDPEAALGLLALGATPGAASRAALEEKAKTGKSEILRAAALRGLADFGDPSSIDLLAGSTGFGGLDPASGYFRLFINGSKAGGALAEIHEVAVAAKSGDGAKAIATILRISKGRFSSDTSARASARGAADWLCRLGRIVPQIDGDQLGGPDGTMLRAICMGSGRRVIPELVEALHKVSGPDQKKLAKVVGATRDPRLKDVVQKLYDSENEAESAAGTAAMDEYRKN